MNVSMAWWWDHGFVLQKGQCSTPPLPVTEWTSPHLHTWGGATQAEAANPREEACRPALQRVQPWRPGRRAPVLSSARGPWARGFLCVLHGQRLHRRASLADALGTRPTRGPALPAQPRALRFPRPSGVPAASDRRRPPTPPIYSAPQLCAAALRLHIASPGSPGGEPLRWPAPRSLRPTRGARQPLGDHTGFRPLPRRGPATSLGFRVPGWHVCPPGQGRQHPGPFRFRVCRISMPVCEPTPETALARPVVPFPSCVQVLLFELPVFVRGIIPFYLFSGDVKGSYRPIGLFRRVLIAAAPDLIYLMHASRQVVQGGAKDPEDAWKRNGLAFRAMLERLLLVC